MKDNLLRRILFLSTLFVLFTNVLVPVSANFVEKPFILNRAEVIDDDFDKAIIDYMNKGHMPSTALAIIKNNSMVWSKGYGYADIKNKKEATNETVYMLASISKTFAATAIMQLWEKGLLDLDDDVNEYLPFNVRNPNYPDVPITFRMILTHRSSIASRIANLFTIFSILRIPYDNMGEYLNPGGKLYSPKNWKDYPPGEKQSYSCTAYELLGYLVECITNQSFPEYCTKYIFQPLDMKNTSYYPSYYKKEQLAVQYIYLLGRYIALPEFEDRNYASGGLRSNLEDLSHYLIAYMNGGQYNGVNILKNNTVELMFTRQYPGDNYIGYGLGWQILSSHNDSENNLRMGHNGGMPGSQTYMFYYTSEDVGIIIFTNQHLSYTMNGLMSWFSIIDLLIDKAKQY
ncbi:MAG: serine hydrolase [Euryarchaeota archaeon]|nr:serine hydrolase [Euryarchaeota archaeon]